MAAPFPRRASRASALLGACLLVAAAAVSAQTAGRVEFSRGVGFAQTPGQTARTLGQGLPLSEGDHLTTSESAFAIIKLQDGTRMTVRPGSEIVLQQYRYREDAADNSMLMQLVRGGFRAVTGLISKGSPSAARVQTSTATIGIRGTDFDARICRKDCAAEGDKVAAAARPSQVLASAKVVGSSGMLSAVDGSGQRRRLVDGGSVYPGDVVETAANTRALLAFRDESKVTLGAQTRFRVDNFVYDRQDAGEGRFLASLLRGSMRALTGLIGKTNTRNVRYSTTTATIGIRGTEFVADCTGPCAGEPGAGGLTLWTFLGAIEVAGSGQTALQVLEAGQGLFMSPQGVVPVDRAPAGPPDPNGIPVPPKLFSSDDIPEASEGLFVYVRDGHIEIATSNDLLELGKGEVGYASNDGTTGRPANMPRFIDFDRLPKPDTRNPLLVSLLAGEGIRQNNQCR